MASSRSRRLATLLSSISRGSERTARTGGALLSRRRMISSASSSAAAAVVADDELGGVLKEYVDYRRSLYGEFTHKALLVDAVGTLLVPAQPTAQIYKNIGEKYGVVYSEAEILTRYRRAYQKPWGQSHLRYVNDARPFWQYIVSASTGCSNSQYFEELYDYFTTEQAWKLCDPEAEKVFKAIKEAGVKVAIVSNFDTRLRPLLRALRCEDWFDAVAVSAEVEAEKPNPTIFLKACELLGVNPEDAVHVGDDRRNDLWGARDAGCDAWLWGSEVTSFKQPFTKKNCKAKMCALVPPLFPNFGWPCGDQGFYVNDDVANTFLDFPLPDLEVAHQNVSSERHRTLGLENPVVMKKLNHNASERGRRKKINAMFSALRSCLPSTNQSANGHTLVPPLKLSEWNSIKSN